MPYCKGLFFCTYGQLVWKIRAVSSVGISKKKGGVALMQTNECTSAGKRLVFTRFITTKSGKRVYKKDGGVFVFEVDD